MAAKQLVFDRIAKKVAKKDIDAMARVPNLRRRGRKYWYHRYIPEDARHLSPFDGREQLWIGLHTEDPVVAKERCLTLTLEHDRIITSFRRGKVATEAFFTDDYICALANAWAADWLHQDEHIRMTQAGTHNRLVSLLGVTHTPESLRQLLLLESKDGFDGLSPSIATDWLNRQTVVMPRDSDAFKKLCYRIRQAAFVTSELLLNNNPMRRLNVYGGY